MGIFNLLRTSRALRSIYNILPTPIRNLYIRRAAAKHDDWFVSPQHSRQKSALEALADKHRGETCILMANGPSLKQTDWNLIERSGLKVIGLNRIALLQEEMGFDPDYLVVIKDLVIEQFPMDIINLKSTKFIDYKSASKMSEFEAQSDLFLIGGRLAPTPAFSKDITKGWYRGYTVTFAALQLAFYLGFRKVIIIGLDHNFNTKGPARRNVVSSGADENHFHPDYFGKGVEWALPDLEGSERYYEVANDTFMKDGREIVDCTTGGLCDVFSKGVLARELS